MPDGHHCGTHLAAPSHFITGGDTIDAIAAQNLISAAAFVPARPD